MSAHTDSRRTLLDDVGSHYSYRRSLSARELLPALGIGIGMGAVAFYVAKIFLERTPLEVAPDSRAASRSSGRLVKSRESTSHPSAR